MAEDYMRYDQMVEDAMRSVVRTALERTAEDGLPGEHHFYITFLTQADGVELPAFLRERYPDEMTIVLQHRFSDLEVGHDGFGVTLSFNDVPARLLIPFSAITAFADPSVRFGFTFATSKATEDEEAAEEEGAPGTPPGADGAGVDGAGADGAGADGVVEAEAPAEEAAAQTPGDTVVSLDRFRKNKG